MTTDEAFEKWCPMARTNYSSDQGNAAINKVDYGDVNNETRCISEECMMWRWNRISKVKNDGYCGLAGIITK